MSSAVTTRPQAPTPPPPHKLAPAPTAGPRRAGVLLARAIGAVLPSSTSTSTSSTAPWAKDDILDALFWIRQALAVVAGVWVPAAASLLAVEMLWKSMRVLYIQM